jgi:hypothetical protein
LGNSIAKAKRSARPKRRRQRPEASAIVIRSIDTGAVIRIAGPDEFQKPKR